MTPPALDQSILLSLLGGGFATAFLHAALPTHWLPFVLVGRAQRWSQGRVLGAVVAAGLAHIAATAAVGGLIVVAGLALDQWLGGVLPYLSAILLFVFGAFYLNQAQGGVGVLAALTVVFAAGTVLGMAVFTLLARAGWSVLRLERWARYEGAVLGLALIAIGLLVVMHQH